MEAMLLWVSAGTAQPPGAEVMAAEPGVAAAQLAGAENDVPTSDACPMPAVTLGVTALTPKALLTPLLNPPPSAPKAPSAPPGLSAAPSPLPSALPPALLIPPPVR